VQKDGYEYGIEEASGKKWTTIAGIVNLATRNHEHDIIGWIRANVKDTKLFLDIGANVGCLSINLSDHFGRIVAVEPQRTNLFSLKNNIEINGIGNIEVVEAAVWSEKKKIFLQEHSTCDYSGTSRTSEAAGGLKSTEIDAITVDSLFLAPSFVKIDIEGAEMECLKGMQETMKYYHPMVLVEVHRCYGVNRDDIIGFMRQFRYKEELISQTSDVFFYLFRQERV
jgi:FkbM family methyltransferase